VAGAVVGQPGRGPGPAASAAMDPTVLQVTCGSCGNQVNVPASLLDGLLRARKFSCPHCGSSQQVRNSCVITHSWRQLQAARLPLAPSRMAL
jgi:predicted RNA-binding Zn-ribbon protein involved in translation (DUF1610 family)